MMSEIEAICRAMYRQKYATTNFDALIDEEREYQKRKWKNDSAYEFDHWILMIENQVNATINLFLDEIAEPHKVSPNKRLTAHFGLVKIAAMCVAARENLRRRRRA